MRIHMRQWFGLVALTTGIVFIGVCACRPKANRSTPARAAASPSPDAGVVSHPSQPPNQRYVEVKPVDLEALTPRRLKANAAFQRTLDKHTAPNDSMAALASALNDAPGSGVLALELAKAARRAGDQNRFSRFSKIADRSVDAFPVLSKPAESIRAKPTGASRQTGPGATAEPRAVPTRKLDGVEKLDDVCGWLTASFKEGRPPVDHVGEQSTNPEECQLTPPQTFAPGLQASTALIRVGDTDERVFAWVVARFNTNIWLSPVVAESFAPVLHPEGNGFFVELQQTEAYKAGLPELTAYVTDRSTVLDVVLNEMVVTDRVRAFVMTFDGRMPQTSPPILLHSRVSRTLVDASDPKPPKGYKHSPDLGKTTEVSFRLEWAENSVRLIPSAAGATQTKALFADH